MENDFETALSGLLNFKHTDQASEEKYGELFRLLITSSMKICGETDFASLVQKKMDEAEKRMNAKMKIAEEESDPYKKLREVIRFEMLQESQACHKDFEICSTESNLNCAMKKIRGELESVVPESQKQVVDSIGKSLYSDFAGFFVGAALDMVADAKIYEMKEFRPLQLNAMGKEIRTYANIVKQQNSRPQKSETVTNWFRTVFVLPAFLFNKLYAVNMIGMFENAEKQMDDANRMFELFEDKFKKFSAGDEYEILKGFLNVLDLNDCFTIRPKLPKSESKAAIN